MPLNVNSNDIISIVMIIAPLIFMYKLINSSSDQITYIKSNDIPNDCDLQIISSGNIKIKYTKINKL